MDWQSSRPGVSYAFRIDSFPERVLRELVFVNEFNA